MAVCFVMWGLAIRSEMFGYYDLGFRVRVRAFINMILGSGLRPFVLSFGFRASVLCILVKGIALRYHGLRLLYHDLGPGVEASRLMIEGSGLL